MTAKTAPPAGGRERRRPAAGRASACRLCGGTDGEPVGPAGPPFRSEVDGEAFLHPGYRALRCGGCGTVFKSDAPTSAELDRYYQTIDYKSWDCDGLFPTERRVLRELSDLPPGSRVLDFGCGSGRMLGTVAGRFRCLGFEINAASAAAAAGRGLTMLGEDELFAPDGEPFDAVVLIDVYEHLADPLPLLRRLASRLRVGGRLVLVTGNADAAAARKDPANFWYFRIYGHLLMLSRRSGPYIAEALGLRLRSWIETSHYDRPPLRRRLALALRERAFDAFHRDGSKLTRGVLRMLPVLNRAERWTERPSRNYTADHAVAVYEKTATDPPR